MERPKTEPSSDLRQAAAACWETFTALRDEGFTDHQALIIVGQILGAGIAKGGQDS